MTNDYGSNLVHLEGTRMKKIVNFNWDVEVKLIRRWKTVFALAVSMLPEFDLLSDVSVIVLWQVLLPKTQ